MKTLNTSVSLIEKEDIPGLHFLKDDVLEDPGERLKRRWELNRAARLGNTYHGKVEITFRTADGTDKRVETTVWTVDDKFVTLKAGCAIPLRAIVDVEFF